MIRQIRKILPVLTLVLMLVAGMTSAVSAESRSYDGTCTFKSNKAMKSDFSSQKVADEVRNLQPGDDVTFTVEYKNEYPETTDWYMENEVVRTLERLDKARTEGRTAGVDNPGDGGYTYILTLHDGKGKDTILYSNRKAGGEEGTVPDLENPSKDLTGLEPSTNALDDWFYIDTLEQNQSGSVELYIAFDGETEVNDYMDTDGELNLRFAVELGSKTRKIVKTGDQSRLLMWSAIGLVAGLLLLILAFFSRKRDKKAAQGKGGRA